MKSRNKDSVNLGMQHSILGKHTYKMYISSYFYNCNKLAKAKFKIKTCFQSRATVMTGSHSAQ